MLSEELPARTGTVLYKLDANVDVALMQLEETYQFSSDPVAGQEALLADVEKILSDPAVPAEVTLRIAAVYGTPEIEPAIRGPLGLYLGLNAATALATTGEENDEVLADARAWLKQPEVVDCLCRFYKIDPAVLDLSHRDSMLHRVGTTSVIFLCWTVPQRAEEREPRALKCLLPRYFGVQAILERTEKYEEDQPFIHPSVPQVHDSSDKTIILTFVAGDTLADRIKHNVVPDVLNEKEVPLPDQPKEIACRRALKQQDIGFIQKMFTALCNVLGDLYDDGHRHLDLSPFNIIIKGETEQALDVALIDFGHNFAVTERVGSSAAVRRAGLYVAPELLEDRLREIEQPEDNWRCDAYSLGVILLEMAARRRIDKHDLTRELDRLWQGDGSWNGALGLARVVEELIDENPSRRLLLMGDSSSAEGSPEERRAVNPYRYLGKLVRQETEVQALYERRSAGVGFGLLKGRGLLRGTGNIQLMNLLEAEETVQEPVDDTYRDYPALGRWTGAAIASWIVVLAAFLAFTGADLHVAVLRPALQQAVDTANAPFTVGDFWGNIPGRLVALTFALTQVTYYVNNYSFFSPKRLKSRLGLVSEWVVRGNVVLLTIPVLWTMVWQPTAWPLCSGLGTLLVVLNNYFSLRIARRANDVGRRRFSTLSDTGRKFVEEVYSEWWRLMGFYSLSMIGIGILLGVGRAHDAWLFALLVVFINMGKMYRLNCIRFAPQVRGCLARAILTLRRSERVLDEPHEQAAGAARPVPSVIRTVMRARDASQHPPAMRS